MSTAREAIIDKLNQDFGIEPDENRGVPLKDPITELEAVSEGQGQAPEKEPEKPEEEITEEVAEGQDAEPVEEQEQTEEIQAEGQREPFWFNDYIKQTGWSLEEGYRDLHVKGPDGEPITIGEALDVNNELRAENESLRQERQQLEEKATQVEQPMQQYAPEAVQLMSDANYLQRALDTYTEDGTFDKMEAVEALKLKADYKDKIERLVRTAQHKQQEYQKEAEVKVREQMVKIDAEMRKEIPEWRTVSVKNQEVDAIADYLRSNGAEQQTVEQLKYNPWAMKMLRRLWKFEQQQAETRKAIKEVKRVPKTLSPSARVERKSNASPASVGKKLDAAKGRSQWTQTLLTEDLGVAPD